MQVHLKVLEGFVRIYKTKEDIKTRPEPSAAPYECDLPSGWGVGSASSVDDFREGIFEITALEDGALRVYHPASEARMELPNGESQKFRTIEENALTVSDGF